MKFSMERISKNELISCRQILAAMIIFGFLLHHIVQSNMSIAIVGMISHNNSDVSSTTIYFDWDENEKNDILGSYFWGNLIAKVPAGRFSEMYGPRKSFGIALLISTLVTFLTPAACYLGVYSAILSRVILGISLSFFLPTLPTLIKKWVPPTSRFTFISQLLVFSLCILLTLVIYGYLLSLFQWTGIFYFVGCISLIWTISWFYFIYDSPEQHPRITDDEKNEIQKAIKEEICLNGTEKIPWLEIFTSGPVWACLVAYASFAFSNSLTASQMPSYLSQVLQVDIKNLGLLANIPYIMTYIIVALFFYTYDDWKQTQVGSAITDWKILFSIGFLIQLLFFLTQSVFGDSCVLTIVTFSICEVIGHGGMIILLLNVMDLSPNFSGTIYGIATMGGDIVSYLQTEVVAYYTYERQDFEHWQSVMLFIVATKAIGLVVYFIYSSREVQKWNSKEPNQQKLLV